MSMTKKELLEIATSLEIDVPSRATKQELLDLIEGV